MRVTIAVDATAAKGGGGPSRVRELLRWFPTLAPDNRYRFHLPTDLQTDAVPHPSVEIRRVPAPVRGTAARVLWEHTVLPRSLRLDPPDWLLSPFNVLPARGGSPATRRAVIVSNIAPFDPAVSRALGKRAQPRIRLLRALTEHSIRTADVVFLLSEQARSSLGRHLEASRVELLPMSPPDAALVREAKNLDLRGGHPASFFLAVGDLLPYKGIEDAIRAVRVLDRDDVHLLICGRARDRSYRWSLERLARYAPGRIHFLGPTAHVRTLALMSRSIATISCSRLENPGRVPIEAMAIGSAVIAAAAPSAIESCGDAAAYYPAGDHVELATVMDRLLSGTARHELIQRGGARVASLPPEEASRRILIALDALEP